MNTEPIVVEVDTNDISGKNPENATALVIEAMRRREIDGIPRYVTADGRIMKCDWELSSEYLEDDLEGESLEEYIRKLVGEQGGPGNS